MRLRVSIVETGFLLVVKRACHSLVMIVLIFIRFKVPSESFYVVGTMLSCHLVYIAVILLSMMIMTSQ